MPLIWCSISGHGFGHAAQVVPVLNELGKQHPNVKAILRTSVPDWFFSGRLTIPWELSKAEQDIGCIQKGPLVINGPATWEAYQCFHEKWEEKVEREVEAIQSYRPNCVLSNISYLAIEAGVRVGRPTVGMGSLSWDLILKGLGLNDDKPIRSLIQQIQETYRKTDLLIRLMPGLSMEAFPRIQDVGPIGRVFKVNNPSPKNALQVTDKIVLVALGGVPLSHLPFDTLNRLEGFRLILDMPVPREYSRLQSLEDLEMGFDDVFSAADIIVAKLGYGILVESIGAGKPIVYVRRYNFADEGPLVDYATRYGRAHELSRQRFFSGDWKEALEEAQTVAQPDEKVPEWGTSQAASLLFQILSG